MESIKQKIEQVKKKREFSKLPNTIVERALNHCKGEIKETRAFLRKYLNLNLN